MVRDATEVLISELEELRAENERLRTENAEQKAEIERLTSQIEIMQETIDGFTGGDVWLLMSQCNYLADQLSQFTGRPIPDELEEAKRECWPDSDLASGNRISLESATEGSNERSA